MCDYSESSQLNLWLYTLRGLEQCRTRANREARKALVKAAAAATSTTSSEMPPPSPPPLAESFASGYTQRCQQQFGKLEEDMSADDVADDGPWQNENGHAFVTPADEALLISFYASKIPNLIGPAAQVSRLRRDIKVAATAALLFRRFYLSNSVMIHDPKAVMVAAAFLGSKIEDATTDVRYLEEGTQRMQAPVTTPEIITAELILATGIHFNFLCFHPYKAVLALTEDLRTFLKSDKGKTLARFPNQHDRIIVGQDLKPMHDAARKLIDDVIVSDIPLLYSPGQVGLAALIVANDELREQQQQQQPPEGNSGEQIQEIPEIDLRGYIRHRFEDHQDRNDIEEVIDNLCDMLKGLRHGQYNCGNHQVDMAMLKSVHKKLKKCRAWGNETSSGEGKKKKRKNRDEDGINELSQSQDSESDSKRLKPTSD